MKQVTFEGLQEAGDSEQISETASVLLEKVDRIVQSHKAELHKVLDGWLQQKQVLCLQPQHATRIFDNQELHDVDLAGKSLPSLLGTEEDLLHQKKQGQIPASLNYGVDSMVAHRQERTRNKPRRKKSRSQSLFAERREEAVESETSLQRFTRSRHYEWFSGLLIGCNAVFIGCECEFMASRALQFADHNLPPPAPGPAGFLAVQVCFTCLFFVELVLRWVAEGLYKFFLVPDRWWNLLDVIVVSFSIIDVLSELAFLGEEQHSGGVGLGTVSALRVLRICRVMKVVKIIRVMKFFRELRMMMYSIFGSMKSLIWVVLVLALTFYMFGIAFTAGVTSYLELPNQEHDKQNEDVSKYFGSLGRSMLSLMMAMSGGNDWGQYYEALDRLSWEYSVLFLGFITFSIFAVVNIVTGVFVENAMQSSYEDREIVIHEEMEQKKEYLKILQDIFIEMDKDDEGSINLDQFEHSMNDERVIAYFNALKLDVSDAKNLFYVLDVDSSDEVSIVEFLTGCFHLQGEARSLDTKIMRRQLDTLQEIMQINNRQLRKMMCSFTSHVQGKGEVQACIHSSIAKE